MASSIMGFSSNSVPSDVQNELTVKMRGGYRHTGRYTVPSRMSQRIITADNCTIYWSQFPVIAAGLPNHRSFMNLFVCIITPNYLAQ